MTPFYTDPWLTIYGATQPYPGAHFAVMPEALVEPCVLAGCPDKACGQCGAPWERVVERGMSDYERLGKVRATRNDHQPGNVGSTRTANGTVPSLKAAASTTTGWRPTCAHADAPTVPGVTLDPFGGSGTVARVANRLSRRAVLIDLNPDYLEQQMKRNRDMPLGLTA